MSGIFLLQELCSELHREMRNAPSTDPFRALGLVYRWDENTDENVDVIAHYRVSILELVAGEQGA